MDTVYIVAIVAAAVAILALAVIFRKRLTRLGLKFKGFFFELNAEPDQGATKLRPHIGKGVVLDESKFKRANVKVTNSVFETRGSQVKDSSFDVSESPASGDRPHD